jgi:hypothetical protein
MSLHQGSDFRRLPAITSGRTAQSSYSNPFAMSQLHDSSPFHRGFAASALFATGF